jgi:hypothetical protein
MAVTVSVVGLTTDPTLIASAEAGEFGHVRVRNRAAGKTIYLGGSAVTTSGWPQSTGDQDFEIDLFPLDALYGTSTEAGGSISVFTMTTRDL